MTYLNFFKKNQKGFSVIIIALIVIGTFILIANQAQAQNWLPWNWGKAALSGIVNVSFYLVTKVLMGVTYIIWFIFGVILQLAAWFLDWVLSSASFTVFTKANIVQTGWTLCRDLANMFFALILIIISFATILRIESYGIKQVLPKLIIAALLINFSLVIAGVIIDFSQVLTKYFVDAVRGGGSFVAVEIAKGLNINDLTEPPKSMDDQAVGTINAFLLFIPQLLLGIVVMLVAAFVLFAGAILLIIRTVALWFLLILAPLAWLFYILPTTKGYWDMWWRTFLKWVFFAPAYTFFFYLSMTAIKSGTIKEDAGVQAMSAGVSNASKFFDLKFFINYVIIIGFLMGSLIVAQKMGIWGAGAFMGVAKAAGKTVGKFAARKGTGYDRWAPAATAAAGVALRNIGFRKTGGIIQGKAIQMREKQLERPENKAYMKYISSLAPDQQLNELNRTKGQNALMVALAAQASGALNNAPKPLANKAAEIFRQFGKDKEARELAQKRPDMYATPEQVEESIKKAAEEGNLNLISAIALGDERVAAAFAKYASPQQIEATRNKSPQYEAALKAGLDAASKNSKTQYAAKVSAGTATAADTEEDNKIQSAYASQTGDTNRLSLAQAQEWAKKAGAEGLKRIQNFDSTNIIHTTIVENMPANKLRNIIENLSDDALAKNIVTHIKGTLGASGNVIANKDPYLSNL